MRARSFLSCALAASAVTGIFLMGAPSAGAEPVAQVAPAAAADELPPVAVEDFVYPNADKIFAEQGIRLKRGDGHILLADCASATGLVEVWSRDKGKFCFKVTGASGFLSLELPQVYGVKGNDYTLRVDMEVAGTGTEASFDVAKNAWTPVGESADPENRDHTLLELHATK
ncbi:MULTISPECIES: hypothetical protein [Streptomyces]|uniref:hypothetical protein n=1 Tax=Streptomyces TaxID=1883 RepID=UPI000D1B8599|nr:MULTISPECIES: hypothetical protein [unclassified Streptomyces]QNQ36840.1 hypothetical protein HYC88_26305 [Streptomyces sp. CB00271]